MTIANCDFCGKKTEVKRTHYGSGFGYVRLICAKCAKCAKYIKESTSDKLCRITCDKICKK